MTVFSNSDEQQMRRALSLARQGRGLVEPNPLVGAVLCRDGDVVGEGWHRAFGEPHAEVEAIRACREGGGDTIFVGLEPCQHQGKTPPCTMAISRAGIRRVVIGMEDPNPDVKGGGAQALRQAGIQVDRGCLEAEWRKLNAPFEKYVTRKVPYVTAKWAMSLDGRLSAGSGDSRWISSEASRKEVHDLRGEVDAVLVGIGTVLKDDPRLDCRTEPKRIARRVVADSLARTPPGCKLLTGEGEGEVIIAVTSAAPKDKISALEDAGAVVWVLPGEGEEVDLRLLLSWLGSVGATNLLVEGGPTILGSLFRAGEVDRVLCYVAPSILGIDARVEMAGESVGLEDVSVRSVDGDTLIEGTVRRQGE